MNVFLSGEETVYVPMNDISFYDSGGLQPEEMNEPEGLEVLRMRYEGGWAKVDGEIVEGYEATPEQAETEFIQRDLEEVPGRAVGNYSIETDPQWREFIPGIQPYFIGAFAGPDPDRMMSYLNEFSEERFPANWQEAVEGEKSVSGEFSDVEVILSGDHMASDGEVYTRSMMDPFNKTANATLIVDAEDSRQSFERLQESRDYLETRFQEIADRQSQKRLRDFLRQVW